MTKFEYYVKFHQDYKKNNKGNSFRMKLRKETRISAYTIAKVLNIAPSTAYLKMRKNTFLYDEMKKLQQEYFPRQTIDELFGPRKS